MAYCWLIWMFSIGALLIGLLKDYAFEAAIPPKNYDACDDGFRSLVVQPTGREIFKSFSSMSYFS